MSRAYKCDRCGKIFTYDPDITSTKHKLWIGTEKMDFCRECTDSLDIWLEAGKEEDALTAVLSTAEKGEKG